MAMAALRREGRRFASQPRSKYLWEPAQFQLKLKPDEECEEYPEDHKVNEDGCSLKALRIQVKAENSRGLWQPFTALHGDTPSVSVKKDVIVTISSDKGLCGGINSTSVKISKALHKLNAGPEKETKYVILGEKAKAQLICDSKDIELCITELQKNPLNYTHVTAYLKKSKGKKKRKMSFNPELSSTLSLGTFEELNKAQRMVLDPPCEASNLIPGDVLWSDPSMDPGLSLNQLRGAGLLWGPDCTEEFLKKFQLKLIIRLHEGPDARKKRPGLGRMDNRFTIDHVVELGKLITLFSAPDYPQFQATDDRHRNKGAYIVLEPPTFDNPVIRSFEAVTPRPQANPFYDFEDLSDSDQESDSGAMETTP